MESLDVNNVCLFGTATRTTTLLTIYLLQETHPTEIARAIEVSVSQARKAIDSLERAGVVVGGYEGRSRRVRLNPRAAYLAELQSLLARLAASHPELIGRLETARRRPRRAGKAV